MKETKKTFDKTEDDLKALQSMGQIIGEVLRQLDDEKCASPPSDPAPARAVQTGAGQPAKFHPASPFFAHPART